MKATTVTLVSIDIGPTGGGVALLGRLMASVTSDYCKDQNISFSVMNLGFATDILQNVEIEHFNQNQWAMARAIWQKQFKPPKQIFIFDHLGPARTQAYVPHFSRKPYLLFLHGIEVWRSLTWDRRLAVKNATIRLTNSAYTLRKMKRSYPSLPPVNILHLALEEKIALGEPDQYLLERIGHDFLLIVGRMSSSERYKGHDELIHVMPRIVEACPQAKLVIAGGGDDLDRLRSLTQTLQVHHHVVFTGFVSEATLRTLYERCRAFVMPSRNEGFGLVFLEAMRARKPCVALARTAPAEIIEDNVTGFLIQDNDPEQLANALIRLLVDRKLSERLGHAGDIRWKESFSYNNFQTRLIEYLDYLVNGQ